MRATVEGMDPERRTAHLALVGALQDLNLAGATTALDAAELDRATAQVAELTRVLGKDTTPRVVRSGFLEPRERARGGKPLDINVLNPALVGVRVTYDHETRGAAGVAEVVAGGDPTGFSASAELTVDALNEGPPDSVHGGIIAFLMDCLLGVLVQATGTPSVTGTLDVRYLRRTPLDEPIVLTARIAEARGRKLFAEGWIHHGETRTVESHGLFIAVQPHAGT